MLALPEADVSATDRPAPAPRVAHTEDGPHAAAAYRYYDAIIASPVIDQST